ncbi:MULTISPECIES: C40 family peptidase [Sphingomonas]|uniref:C40 family peptidase n=1 Tax=Sphingomonas TaxID=13687 RepID=UPI0015EB586C|nr:MULTISPECIES: C40 family peptidase [Sphingomonas]MBA2920367.1 C40 family peptidase [Sphingomonas sp. CGMCC 1.13658]
MNISKRSSAAAATAKAARSATTAAKPANRCTPDRPTFALTGPSRALDYRQNAARRDLADIALAGQWFAPHYAVPQERRCRAGGADMLSADSKGTRISQLLPGEGFAVLEWSGDWAWGYSAHDRYVGYVRAAALAETAEATHIVESRTALMFAEPSSRSAVAAVLPMGSRLAGRVDGDFLETGDGFVAVQQLRPVAEAIADPVAAAERLVDTPYLWGGRGIGGIDCSGLVQVVFGLAGIALPRDSDQQRTAGRAADGEIRRGDLLFWDDHVIIASGGDRAVHANGHWMRTIEEPLDVIIARLGEPVARRRVLP